MLLEENLRRGTLYVYLCVEGEGAAEKIPALLDKTHRRWVVVAQGELGQLTPGIGVCVEIEPESGGKFSASLWIDGEIVEFHERETLQFLVALAKRAMTIQ